MQVHARTCVGGACYQKGQVLVGHGALSLAVALILSLPIATHTPCLQGRFSPPTRTRSPSRTRARTRTRAA